MELVIYAPEQGKLSNEIKFNYEEIREYLSESLARYQSLVYDDESIKAAKGDRAKLNNLKAAFDGKRKEIKSMYLEPYTAFEIKIKDLISMVDQPLLAIDEQVKEYDARRKNEKRKQVMLIYDEIFEDSLKEILPFDRIENIKWSNVTFSLNDARSEIEQIYADFTTGIKVIKDKKSPYEVSLIEQFCRTRNLADVLLAEERLQASQVAMKKVSPAPMAEEVEQPFIEQELPSQEPDEARRWVDFSLYMTEKEINFLKNWIRVNRIEIKRAGGNQ